MHLQIAKTAHKWTDNDEGDGWTVETKGTCTVAEVLKRTCKVCNTEETKKGDLNPDNHTADDVAKKDATCTEAGNEAGKKCTGCGKVTEGCQVIPPLGHQASTEWSSDDDHHWHVCGRASCTTKNVKLNEGTHFYDPTTGICVCGKKAEYNITVTITGNGDIEVSETPVAVRAATNEPPKFAVGTSITLTVKPNAGNQLKEGSLIVKQGETDVKLTETTTGCTFTMPNGNVTVTAEFEAKEHTVKLAGTVTNGKIIIGTQGQELTATGVQIEVGAYFNVTAEADKGYQLKAGSLKVTTGENEAVTFEENKGYLMPDGEVTVTAEFEKVEYNITTKAEGVTFTVDKSGTATAVTTATMGDTVTIVIPSGKSITTVACASGEGTSQTKVDVTNTNDVFTFEMPAADVTVTVTLEDLYTVIIDNDISGGTVKALLANGNEAPEKGVTAGATITLAVTAADGYQLKADSLKVTYPAPTGDDKNHVENVETTSGTNGTYTFTMPAADVTVTVTFEETTTP